MRCLFVVLLAAALAGCDLGGDCGIEDGPSDFAVLTNLAIDPVTGIAVVPVAGQRVVDECALEIEQDGALLFFDPAAGVARRMSSPVMPARGVVADGQLVVLSGTWSETMGTVLGPGPGIEVFRAPFETPSSGSVAGLPTYATGLVAVGGRSFLPLPSASSVLVLRADSPDVMIPVAPGPQAVAVVAGKVLVATMSGFVSEIDALSLAETRRLSACPSLSLAALGPQDVLLACESGGLGVVDLATGAFALLHTDQRFSLVMGNDVTPAAFAWTGTSEYDNYAATRLFVLGSGLVGPGYSGRPVGAVFPGTENAIALIDRDLVLFPFNSDDPERHFGFPYRLGAIGLTEAGLIVGAGAHAGDPPNYSNGRGVFVTVDPVSGELEGPVVDIPKPSDGNGGCGCVLGRDVASPLRSPFAIVAAFTIALIVTSRRRA